MVVPFGYKSKAYKIPENKRLVPGVLRRLDMISGEKRGSLLVKSGNDLISMYEFSGACACVIERYRLLLWPPTKGVKWLQDVKKCVYIYGYVFSQRPSMDVENKFHRVGKIR